MTIKFFLTWKFTCLLLPNFLYLFFVSQDQLPGSGNFGLSAPKREKKQITQNSDFSKYGTVKKSFNRYSFRYKRVSLYCKPTFIWCEKILWGPREPRHHNIFCCLPVIKISGILLSGYVILDHKNESLQTVVYFW